MIVYIALMRKANKEWDNLTKLETKAIQWWTDSEYFHSELVVQDKMIGMHTSGLIIRDINTISDEIKNKSWKFIPIKVKYDKILIEEFWNFVSEQRSKKYDWKGIFLTQFLTIGIHCYKCWFCSELTVKLLQVLCEPQSLRLFPSRISPEKLNKIYGSNK